MKTQLQQAQIRRRVLLKRPLRISVIATVYTLNPETDRYEKGEYWLHFQVSNENNQEYITCMTTSLDENGNMQDTNWGEKMYKEFGGASGVTFE